MASKSSLVKFRKIGCRDTHPDVCVDLAPLYGNQTRDTSFLGLYFVRFDKKKKHKRAQMDDYIEEKINIAFLLYVAGQGIIGELFGCRILNDTSETEHLTLPLDPLEAVANIHPK